MEIFGVILTSSVVSALISGIIQYIIKSMEIKKQKESIKYEFLKSKLDSLTSPRNFDNYMRQRNFLATTIQDELDILYREYGTIYEAVMFDLRKKDIVILNKLCKTDRELFMDKFYEILQKEVSRLRE